MCETVSCPSIRISSAKSFILNPKTYAPPLGLNQLRGGALIWLIALWGLILWMILSFCQVSPMAAKLQIPYLLWVTFAGYLNAGVWLLN